MQSLPQNNSPFNPSPLKRGTPIEVGGRVVGYVRDGTFHKRLVGSKHFLRRPPAIALDLQSLHDAAAAGATRVRIFDIEGDAYYNALVTTILRKGFAFDRGHGVQIALPLAQWNLYPDHEDLQLSLFATTGAAR